MKGVPLDHHERISILQDVFDCSAELAAQVDGEMTIQDFSKSTPILHQGDSVSTCSLVIEGRANARVLGAEGQYIQLATYEPGEIFGAYPYDDEQRADILADEGLVILSIKSAALSSYAKQHADVGSGLARIFAGQTNILFDRMASRATLSAAGRVYAELLRRANPDRRILPPPVVSALAVTVQTTRETASRAISRLEKRGVINRQPDHWEIVAPRQLEDMIA